MVTPEGRFCISIFTKSVKLDEEMAAPTKPRRNKKVEDPLVVESPAPADEDWVEDADCNFVPKDA